MVVLKLPVALLCLALLLQHRPCHPQTQVQEAADGSVCFNNCHGHGTCVDYTCQCWPGYYGDDCGTAYVKEGERVVPILAAGHFNVTRKNFTAALAKHKFILVGFSAYTCHRCIEVEPEYERIADALTTLGVPFARADADSMKSIALEHSATELPALVLFHKNRPLPYRGVHSLPAVTTYVNKQRAAKPYAVLKTVEDVNVFFASRDTPAYSLSTALVVGFFADHEGIEEDEFEDFVEAAEDFRAKEDVYFAAVTSRATCEWFKKNKSIDRTPAVLLRGEQGAQHAINLNELYGEKGGLKGWVNDNAIPLVGHLTNENFKLYDKIAKPMLILFLDLTHAHATNSPGHIIGGKSGGVLNEALLVELREVARELADKVTFVYIDGTRHEDQMRSLGLFGGRCVRRSPCARPHAPCVCFPLPALSRTQTHTHTPPRYWPPQGAPAVDRLQHPRRPTGAVLSRPYRGPYLVPYLTATPTTACRCAMTWLEASHAACRHLTHVLAHQPPPCRCLSPRNSRSTETR